MDTITWLRQFRFGEYAFFDLAVSFLGMLLLSPLLTRIALKFRVIVPKKNWVLLTLPIGIVTHMLVGTYTPMTKNVLALDGHYVLKFICFTFLVLGLVGIKIKKGTKKK